VPKFVKPVQHFKDSNGTNTYKQVQIQTWQIQCERLPEKPSPSQLAAYSY